MFNTYISSTITFRTKGYVYNPSSDYHHLLTSNSSVSTTSTCTCCAFPFNGVPLNPGFLHGLRQSTLIHYSASKRLILGGGDRFFRLPGCDFDRFCNGGPYSIEKSCRCCCTRKSRIDCCDDRWKSCECSSTRRRSGGSGRRFKCMVWEEKSESFDSGGDGSVDEMLGLLTEYGDAEFVGVRGRRSRMVTGGVQENRRGRGSTNYREKKKYEEPDCLERSSKGRLESIRNLRGEDIRLSGRKEGSLRGETRDVRRQGAGLSSYYYDDIDGSDVDVQVIHGQFGGEASSRNSKEVRRNEENIYVKNVIKQSKTNEDDAAEYRENSTKESSMMGSTSAVAGSDQYSRNERDSKLNVTIRQGGSSSGSLNRLSNVVDSHKTDIQTTFVSQDRFRDEGDNLVSSTCLVDKTRDQHNQQGESRWQTKCHTEISQIKDTDNARASSSQTRFRGRERNSVAPVNLLEEEERETHNQTGRIIAQNESRRDSQQLSGMLERHDTDLTCTSSSQRQSESTLKNKEETSMSSFYKAAEHNSQTDQRVVSETKSMKESQGLYISRSGHKDMSKIKDSRNVLERKTSPREEVSASNASQMSRNHESNIRKTSTSQRLFESTLKNREETSNTRLSSFHEAENQDQSAQRVLETESAKIIRSLTNISAANIGDTTVVSSDSHKLFERRSPPEEKSVSDLDLVKEARKESPHQASEHFIEHLMPREESETLTKLSTLRESSAHSASSSQPFDVSQQYSEQQIVERKGNEGNSQVMIPPPSQNLHRTSSETVCYKKPTTGNVYSEIPVSGSSTLSTQEIPLSSPDEYDSGIRMENVYEDQSQILFHEDALGSVKRQEEASAQFVRQLVENLSPEVSFSELPGEKRSSGMASTSKNVEYTRQSLNEQGPQDIQSQVLDSRKSSSWSGARGPSAEIWDVAGLFAEESARTEAPSEVTSTIKSVVVRSGKSLWSIIGDIVRLRWGTRSETHNSKTKAEGKSSSNESVGSEAWFSSHGADENDDENIKKERLNMPKLDVSSDQPSPRKDGNQRLGGASEGMSSNNRLLQIEADILPSVDTVEGGSAFRGASSASKEEINSQKLDQLSGQGILASTSTPSSSPPLPSRHFTRSPAVKGEIPESSKALISRSEYVQTEQPIRESPTEGFTAAVMDGELKRRKFQRTNQVEKGTFGEWEEAYRLESEQRKLDEMFMKEALLEAKKAADTWEVPVGAVLVQHGKIVARGCNLVEDLRDSTAHAEMICIREASKALRTWRLAGTTLYVTLEPCAMCAGAILQSRIDTVVWGAPNKLLGADGSWVRLFPVEGEVGASADLTSQPAGPVHPFHPKITIRRRILATECADAMQQFFQLRRKTKRSDSPPASSLPVSNHPAKFISKMHDIFSIMFCW